MASVYIIYSDKIDRYYIGSCLDLEARIKEHNSGIKKIAFTSQSNDWRLVISITHLEFNQARQIEKHIKSMKSRTYIENLKMYPEIIEKLKDKYPPGSSR